MRLLVGVRQTNSRVFLGADVNQFDRSTVGTMTVREIP